MEITRSSDKADKTAGQLVQGAGQPIQPTRLASGTKVRKLYQTADRTHLGT
jgi:hypothetical protein